MCYCDVAYVAALAAVIAFTVAVAAIIIITTVSSVVVAITYAVVLALVDFVVLAAAGGDFLCVLSVKSGKLNIGSISMFAPCCCYSCF